MTKDRNNIRGLIFDIQRYCVHDGPGIRTVVFFKGCPLRCEWCANPESLNVSSELFYNQKDCIGCKRCVQACKRDALVFDGNSIVIDRQKCEICKDCESVCPAGALSVKGQWYTVDEILEIALKDKEFYKNSGGGITLSGGEVLWQSEFATELLRKAKKYGIHTTIETSGYGNWEDIERLLEYTDLVLFDIKHIDDEIHIRYTGVGNKLILENLSRIISICKEIIVRIPIIPNINDNEQSISGYIDILKKLKVKTVNILPFHQLGEAKYEMVGMSYKFKGIRPPSEELIESIRQRIERIGIEAKIGG